MFFSGRNIGSAIFYYSILLETEKEFYARCFQSQHYLSRSLLVKTPIICKYRIFPSRKISSAADLVLLSFPKEALLLIYLKVWVSLLWVRRHELYKDHLKSFTHEKTRAGSKSLFRIFRAFCMAKELNFLLSKLSKCKFQLNLVRSQCYSEE